MIIPGTDETVETQATDSLLGVAYVSRDFQSLLIHLPICSPNDIVSGLGEPVTVSLVPVWTRQGN